jgi:hypothetical protein
VARVSNPRYSKHINQAFLFGKEIAMSYFEESKNRPGVYVLSESAPSWVRDAVQEAHQGSLPNDWVYDVCKSLFDSYDASTVKDAYDFAHEFAEREVDIYNKSIAQ